MKFVFFDDLQALAAKIKATFVAKEAGKGLSANDLTNTLKTNYDAAYTHSTSSHAPSGAQANIIESVKVNGAALTISSKAVDVTVPTKTSQLMNDSNFLNAHPTVTKTTDSASAAAPAAGATFTAIDDVTRDANGHVTKINTKTVTLPETYTKAEVDALVNSLLGASDAMIFKGTLGTGGTVTALPASHKVGDTYKVITAGTHAGLVCEIGDIVICIVTGTTANNAHWTVAQSNLDGAVTGPASSTTNAIALFNGTTGKIISNSSKTIVTTMSGSANVPTDGAVKTFVEGKGYVLSSDIEEITQSEIDALFA